ncbi:MAG: CPBP family intramembrane glutamic endopeptidase [Gemmatimonadaceae bacterium]
MSGPSGVGPAGWAFLFLAGLVLPLAAAIFAAGERRRPVLDTQGSDTGAAGPTRIQLYANALLTHALLLGAAIAAARTSRVALFVPVDPRVRDLVAAVATLAAVVGVGELSWRSRSSGERERLWVRRILPRTRAERRAWVLVSAGAALAEEVAYRGAFLVFAAAATGSVPVAVLLSAAAFAAVHAPQGLAGIGYVFVIALLHQALVLFTGTLVLAIAVHFAYDVLAGLWLARRHGLV